MTDPVTSGCPPQILTAICKSLHHDSLSTFTTDSSGMLYVLWHDGHTLGVNSTQVGVFKQTHQVGLACFLKSAYGSTLEAKIRLEVLCDFTDKTLEWQLPDQQLGRLLVSSDFSKGHSTWSVTMGFLHSSCGWCAFTGCFRGQLFTGRLLSSGFTVRLLRTCHIGIKFSKTKSQLSPTCLLRNGNPSLEHNKADILSNPIRYTSHDATFSLVKIKPFVIGQGYENLQCDWL